MAPRRGPASPPLWPYVTAGLVTALVVLGVAELVSVLFSPASSPLVAVGAAFIDITPAWLKDLAIGLFATADKAVLVIAMVVVTAAIAAGIGVLARWRLVAALALCAVIAVGLCVVVLSRADTDGTDLLPTVLGAVIGLATLRWLVGLAHTVETRTVGTRTVETRTGSAVDGPDAQTARGGDDSTTDRLRFLRSAGVAAVAAGLVAAGGRALSAAGRVAAAARDAVRLPTPRRAAPPLPDGVGVRATGMPPFVTPNTDFYRIDTALAVPQVDPADWQLRIHGMVEQEITLDFDDLLSLELQESWVSLTCVSNPVGGELAGNAKWLGHPVRELLARARPLEGADMVLSTSVDGFTASTPLEALTDGRDDALLAVGMNDEPLPHKHGFPARLVVPGLYGYVSATKWVVDLEVTRFADKAAYWTQRGWSERGPIKLASRIDVPRAGAAVAAGPTTLGGTAWAQTVGIDRIEVQIDDGAWQEADLAAEANVDTWRQWSLDWQATPGDHTARVRAVDHNGEQQTSDHANPVPDGATGWHETHFTVS